MGYTTDFEGYLEINPPLSEAHENYLGAFSSTRRMLRNPHKLVDKSDPVRKAVRLPLGVDGEFYVGSDGIDFGQERTEDIIDYNSPPSTQPGLWCQWTCYGSILEWDGGEKFYEYDKWLQYLLTSFFIPWGYTLNGTIDWSGEENGDLGRLEVVNNVLTVKRAVITYE